MRAAACAPRLLGTAYRKLPFARQRGDLTAAIAW